MGMSFRIMNVYGPIGMEEKSNLWQQLGDMMANMDNNNFAIGGDFNAILNLGEKRGGIIKSMRIIVDFGEFMDNNQLLDVVPNNGLYTWNNRRVGFTNIMERLDPFFLGSFWMRLNFIKNKLKVWNKEVFKNIFEEKTLVESELSNLNEKIIKNGMFQEDYILEKELKSKHAELLAREEVYWRDKAWESWLLEGDQNSKKLHASMKARRSSIRIDGIKSRNSTVHEDTINTREEAVNHFQSILCSNDTPDRHMWEEVLETIPRLVKEKR
ncbi:uncharacterized protein LOC131072015 [Cryptomeria japonica]|uniref:uncharacterized protein LOC131072015 n=1 Tax=Cryptomeria japonica TaxID=3369 RepID=UPI0025AD8C76|nr:uncharacterized protein LOC131072015 [Cryptomeria japonica]